MGLASYGSSMAALGLGGGVGGTAWLGVVSTISTAMVCVVHGICMFLAVKLRVE